MRFKMRGQRHFEVLDPLSLLRSVDSDILPRLFERLFSELGIVLSHRT
jgi:hypothetical protein